jgi:fumarylacetoacetate (FAA) hydrolase
MRLASLNEGRDGRLIVVSTDHSRFIPATGIAATLQAALDDWEHCAPRLAEISAVLNDGHVKGSEFKPELCSSPLPRAYQWADGSAYVNHVELVRKARGASLPTSFWTDPLMYQGGSDGFLGPRDPIPLPDTEWGCDFEGEVAVIVGDVQQGASRDDALASIRLITLVNDVSHRNLIPPELAKGFGFLQSKPASAFAPIALTPDELSDAWLDGKLHRSLIVHLNGEAFGRPDAGVDMTFDFGTLIAHVAKTRSLCAGSIVGSGTISNRSADGGPGLPVANGGVGYACLAEVRAVETMLNGEPLTPFLRPGDAVRIDMVDDLGRSLFGAIEQKIINADGHSAAEVAAPKSI